MTAQTAGCARQVSVQATYQNFCRDRARKYWHCYLSKELRWIEDNITARILLQNAAALPDWSTSAAEQLPTEMICHLVHLPWVLLTHVHACNNNLCQTYSFCSWNRKFFSRLSPVYISVAFCVACWWSGVLLTINLGLHKHTPVLTYLAAVTTKDILSSDKAPSTS